MKAQHVTFRDAGLRSTPLRWLNRLGAAAARIGVGVPALHADAICAAARRQTGLSDFGDGGFREGLEILAEAIEREAHLSTFGRIVMRGLLSGALANRLRLRDWAQRHPEVREERIERPWGILGMPRTGTTLLSILLGLDPSSRPLLQWEASHPVPPPDLATHAEDPRIAVVAKDLEQLQSLNPPIRAMHPMGATLATECVALLIFDARAMSIETQAFVPSYGRWLADTDMRGAFAQHRLALQVLQSKIPTATWVLKTPHHLWCLDALRAEYPDIRLIWMHRDPVKVVPSVASLVTSLQRTNADCVDPLAVGAEWNRRLHDGLMRGMAYADRQKERDWCFHLQYAELMRDPLDAVERLYAHFGESVTALHRRRMEVWMRDRGQDAFGRHHYALADFGLSEEEIDDRYADYCKRFDVPREGR